jgi:hypothetical protein
MGVPFSEFQQLVLKKKGKQELFRQQQKQLCIPVHPDKARKPGDPAKLRFLPGCCRICHTEGCNDYTGLYVRNHNHGNGITTCYG